VHGVVERHAEHVCVEVYGITGQFAFGPTPVRRLDDEALVFQEFQVSGTAIPEGETAFFQQGREYDHAGGAYLCVGPRLWAQGGAAITAWVHRSPFASGVG